jgi:hypothetical protein
MISKSIRLFFLVCLIGCEQYEFPKSIYAKVYTREITPVEDGLRFKGEVKNLVNDQIIEHGFIYVEEFVNIRDHSDTLKLGLRTTDGLFEARATEGLVKGKTYNIKSFLITSTYYLEGNTVSFKYE